MKNSWPGGVNLTPLGKGDGKGGEERIRKVGREEEERRGGGTVVQNGFDLIISGIMLSVRTNAKHELNTPSSSLSTCAFLCVLENVSLTGMRTNSEADLAPRQVVQGSEHNPVFVLHAIYICNIQYLR